MPTLKIKKVHPEAFAPVYSSEDAACFDLCAMEAGEVQPFSSKIFRTGLAVEIPEGWVMEIYSRSGHGFKSGIRLVNAVGIIDADYRGELAVGLRNDSPRTFVVQNGDRIAQAKLQLVVRVQFEWAAELSDTARGAGGFGSTGA